MRVVGLGAAGAGVALFDTAEPELTGDDDVLISSVLTPVNPADAWLLSGGFMSDTQRYPVWAGIEVLGTVKAIGTAVDDLQVGDVVLAGTSFLPRGRGTHAALGVIGHRYRSRLPDGSDPARFAGLPIAAGAATLALDLCGVDAGGLLAVTGAAGAVGRMVVQLARHRNIRVIGVGRRPDRADIEALGCESFVDGSRLLSGLGGKVDAVVDAAALGPATTQLVRPGGRVVALRPFTSDDPDVTVVSTSVAALLTAPSVLSRAVAAVAHGYVAPPPLEQFDARDLDAALTRLAEPGRRGARPVLVW